MSKPLPRKQRVLNRGYLYSRTADDVGDLSVNLIDIDSSIQFYFDEVIQPSVEDNGENVKVPIMYASPERWKAIQRDGFMRDRKRQIITPVIVYRRTSVERDDTVPQDKLDANNPNLFYSFEKKYSRSHRYDNFGLQQGLLPQKEYYNVMFPDYVNLTYEFIVWTTYMEHMNNIVEKVVYSDGAYWGDPNKLRFRSRVESFSDVTEVSDVERLVRTNFTVSLKGYLLPKGNFDHRSTTQKFLTPKKVIIGSEVDGTVTNNVGRAGQFREDLASSTSQVTSTPVGDVDVTVTNGIIFIGGTGITLSQDGVLFDGSTAVTQTLSIGQSVATSDNVTFNQVSASSLVLGDTTFDSNSITGNINITGSVTTTGNFNVNGDAVIEGTITAQEFHTEFVSSSILFASGSTQLGDTIDDTHNFTGSLFVSASSFEINNTSFTGISNDTSLTDSSQTEVVTEHAVKSYVDSEVSEANSYFRKQFVKTSSTITTATASFTAVTASAPISLTATGENDFVFFVNGQYMEHDALQVEQSGSVFLLKVDNDSIGYDLESDDEILAIGKFDS
tara:strand:+ start:2327 stop:4003 length:1677 start_codon:yes stop_codon:yes gene_type:complete